MNFLQIAWKDISSIFKNRFIRVSVIAVIIVPLLYSLLYLAAFWDPYSRLESLPVAVVNLDKGGVNDGKTVNYGGDIIDKLKNNHKLGWRFVSKKDGDSGLRGKKYYAEYIIPSNFSQKILDAQNKTPEAPTILFRTNDKRNFLASQINGKAELQLQTEISKNITEELTKVIFDKLSEIKSGFNKAADGSKTLTDKLGDATDGSKQIKDGLSTLNSSVPALADGVQKLYNGSTQLKNGIGTAKKSVDKVTNKLNANSGTLTMLTQSKTIDATKRLMNDAIYLKDADTSMMYLIPSLASKENMALAQKILTDYQASGIESLLSNPMLKMLPTFATDANMKNISKLVEDTETISNIDYNKLMPVFSALNGSDKLGKILADSQGLVALDTNAINDFLAKQKTGAEQFVSTTKVLSTEANKTALSTAINTNSNLNAAQKAQLLGLVDGYYKLTTQTAQNMADSAKTMEGMSGSITKLSEVQKEIKDNQELIAGLQTALSPENMAYIKQILPQIISMKTDLDNNKQNLAAVKMLLDKANDPETKATIAKITVLQSDIEKAKPLIATLKTQMTAENIKKLEQSPALVKELLSMQKDLQNNDKLLDVAKSALTDNNIKMATTLIKSMPTLTDGINKLYDGSNKLSEGLGTLNSKVPALKDGVNKLYDGSTTLNDGMVKLTDGSATLHKGLQEGADKLNKQLKNSNGTDMSKFASEPVTMTESPINPVKNYGTGFTPYFIPLSLWVGAIMMFFVITDKVDPSIKAGSKSIVAGKFLSYGFIGLMQSVTACAVVMTLGLKPCNIPMYFLFAVLMSYTFIAIIQCLIFLLGDAGRVIAIVLLILQLTSCAGAFPLELVPKFFKVINPYMPFTYCVEALRQTISGMDYVIFGKDCAVLIGVMFVFLFISMVMKGHADKMQEIIEEKKEQMASNM